MNQPSIASLQNQIVTLAAAFAFCGFTAAAQTTPRVDAPATAKPERRIVVSIPDRKLALLKVGDRVSLVGERTEEVARLFGGEPETIVAKNEAHATQDDDARGEL